MGLFDVLASVVGDIVDDSISKLEKNEKELDRAEKNLEREYQKACRKAQGDPERMSNLERKREGYQKQINSRRTDLDLNQIRNQRDELAELYSEWKDSRDN